MCFHRCWKEKYNKKKEEKKEPKQKSLYAMSLNLSSYYFLWLCTLAWYNKMYRTCTVGMTLCKTYGIEEESI